MITILKTTDKGLERITDLADGAWVNLVDPTSVDVEYLHREYEIPKDFITYPLDIHERARTDRENGATLIVVRVPHFQGEHADIPYTTVPVGVIVTSRVIVTVSKIPTGVIDELAAGRPRGLSTAKRNRFVLQLFLMVAHKFLHNLRSIDEAVDGLEDRLQKSPQNREVLELLKYQKSLTYFTTALKSNELMVNRLQRSALFHQFPDDEDLLDDVLTEIQQAVEMTSISSGIVNQMMEAFASIISNNLNVVMKFMAAVTIILSLPTMIASIYGMNVLLPLGSHSLAFPILMGVAALTVLGVIISFKRRDWL